MGQRQIRAGRRAARRLLYLLSASIPVGGGIAMPCVAAAQSAPIEIASAQDAPPLPPARAVPAVPTRINMTGQPIGLVVPLRERFPLGQVSIRIMPDDEILVARDDIAGAVGRIATEEATAAIRGLESADGYVALGTLESIGLVVRYNPSEIELVMDLEATARLRGAVSFSFQTSQYAVEPDQSDGFSIYLAYLASVDYIHTGPRTGLRAPRIDVDLNGRIGRFVAFENELSYDGDASTQFSRRASRLIYDRPAWAMRFTAGDQIPSQTGFQDAVDVFGVGVARLLGVFQSDRVITATSSRSITLREGANVTIVVNGVPARTVRLESGVYDLNDLPITNGANSVQLVIEDDAGGRRTVAFDFFQDFQLLAPGVDEFDGQVGIRSRFDGATRRYATEEPILTAFYRRGLSPQFTAGVNMQLTERAQLVGFEGTVGTKLGLFTLETAFSNIDGFGFGNAQRLQYRYSTPLQQLEGARRLDILVERRSRNFGAVETITPLNNIDWRLTARYGQPINRYVSAGLGVDYASNRGSVRDQYGASAFATWRVGPVTTFSASAGYDNRNKFIFGFNLVHRFGRSSTATAQYDSRDNVASLTYSHSPIRTLDVFAFAGQVTRTSDDIGVNATGIYRSNRGDVELAHRATYDVDVNRISGQTTSLRARGTIAYTGGRVAIGRLLSDSFAIIAAHPSLGGAPVSAPVFVGDRLAGREIARTGALGPALVPLSSYSQQSIPFEVPEAPAGYDLGAGNFPVYPWLNSGRVFVVGSSYNISVIGTLLNDRGEIRPLLVGQARRLDDPSGPVVEVFTNRAGRFGATGLAPGPWRMRFADGTYYDVVIGETQGSFVNLGTLSPATGQQEDPQ